MDHIKNNRILLFAVIGEIVFMLLIGFSLWNQGVEKKELDQNHKELISELNNIEAKTRDRQGEIERKKALSIKEATGLDPTLVGVDTEAAKVYFKPAFDWKSGADYDKARNQYIESLGEDNTFTKTYLPPDTEIDTEEGSLSYIDFKSMKATLGDMYIVPTTAEGDRVRYIAFVQYFMHQNEGDVVNPEALKESEAIVEFTAAGSEGDRRVTEVSARAGFHSSPER